MATAFTNAEVEKMRTLDETTAGCLSCASLTFNPSNPLTLYLRPFLFHPGMHKRPEDVSISGPNKNSHENAQKSP
jgi:hypothetical protein